MKKAGLLFLTVLLIAVAGCGGSSGTGLALFGSLSMDAKLVQDIDGVYHVETTAVYTHPTKDSTGVEINYAITATTTPTYTFAQTSKQGSTGITFTSRTFLSDTVPIFVDVSVSAGDLVQNKRLIIPARKPLAATPVFVNMSTGLSQTVAISGSIGPYTINVNPPGGFSAGIDGSTLTISEAAFQKLNGTVDVYSSLGDLITITVRY